MVDATPPRRDPDTEKIAASIALTSNGFASTLGVYNGQQLLRLHTVIEPARADDDPAKIYWHILVPFQKAGVDEQELNGVGICDLGDGYSLAGVSLTATTGSNPIVEVAALKSDDSYLRAACAALARPDRHIARHMRKLAATNLLGFSLPINAFIIQREKREAPPYEIEWLSLLWPRIFSDTTSNDPFSLALEKFGPTFLFQLASELEESETKKISFSVPDVDTNRPTLESPFPTVKPGSLRSKLELLNAQWFEFLKTVPLKNKSSYLIVHDSGGIDPVFLRFSVNDLGTDAFWLQVTDMDASDGKLGCLISFFAVDLRYVPAADLKNYVECISGYGNRPTLP